MTSTIKGTLHYIAICIGIPVLGIALVGLIASVAEAAPSPHPIAHECASAAEWGPAPDSVRPCVTLKANAPEVGALRFVVSDASGVVRYSGFINSPFHRIASVSVVGLYEDGSLRYSVTNFNGKRAEGGIGNLTD
jgi:hypothetical protein